MKRSRCSPGTTKSFLPFVHLFPGDRKLLEMACNMMGQSNRRFDCGIRSLRQRQVIPCDPIIARRHNPEGTSRSGAF